jgi:hypothetical protein
MDRVGDCARMMHFHEVSAWVPLEGGQSTAEQKARKGRHCHSIFEHGKPAERKVHFDFMNVFSCSYLGCDEFSRRSSSSMAWDRVAMTSIS